MTMFGRNSTADVRADSQPATNQWSCTQSSPLPHVLPCTLLYTTFGPAYVDMRISYM